MVDVELREAHGQAEREAALTMLARNAPGRATCGADRSSNTRDFVATLRDRGITPHAGYRQSQRRRKLQPR